jgi:hypothetical protein
MIITDEWLVNNKTKAGGYTKTQLALVGVDWPPVHGWKKTVIGTELSEENKKTFEQLSQKTKL